MFEGRRSSTVRSTDAANIGAGGLDANALLLHRKQHWILDFVTSIRTERALRFVLPIPLLLYMSYKPVPVMIFGHLCITLYTIQAALLPPIITMVPIVLCCALPAIVIALAMVSLFWLIFVECGQNKITEFQANLLVISISFFYFLLASNLRTGKLANIMTIAYYALVYALEYASIMTKYIMIHGITAHLAPNTVRNFIPTWLVNALPSYLFDAIDNLPINIDADLGPGLLGEYMSYRGFKRLAGVPVHLMGSIKAGVLGMLPTGTYLIRFAWESEKQFGIISSLITWAFISYAAFCVTLFLPPWRTGTKLYQNAIVGCHATIAANVIDWLKRSKDPINSDFPVEEVQELKEAVLMVDLAYLEKTEEKDNARAVSRRRRQMTILPPARPSSMRNNDPSSTSNKGSPNKGHLRFADDLVDEVSDHCDIPTPESPQITSIPATDLNPAGIADEQDFNPYHGYDVTRFQTVVEARDFAHNENVTKIMSKYPSYRARLELTDQTVNTMQGPLLLSAFETALSVGNQDTTHNFSNDLPERLKVGPILLEIALWLYVIQIQTTLHAVLAERAPIIVEPKLSLGGGGAELPTSSSILGPNILLPSPSEDIDPAKIGKSLSIQSNRLSTSSIDKRRSSGMIDALSVERLSQSINLMEEQSESRSGSLTPGVSFRGSDLAMAGDVVGPTRVPRAASGSPRPSVTFESLDSSPSEEGEDDSEVEDTSTTPIQRSKSNSHGSGDSKPEVSASSKFVEFVSRQRDKRIESQVIPAFRNRKRASSAVNIEPPASKEDLIAEMLLSVYHALRVSERNDNSKASLNEAYAERKILITFQKLCELFQSSERYSLFPLYKNGLLTSVIELLDLRRDAFIQIRTRSWKRVAISFGTFVMGIPLFFYSLFLPWLQTLRHLAEDRKFNYSSTERLVEFESQHNEVKSAKIILNPTSASMTAPEEHVATLLLKVKGNAYDWRFNSALWFAIRLAVGNTLLFGLAIFLDSWRTLHVESQPSDLALDKIIDMEKLFGTKYAAWACIGFITTITETAPATLKRALLRLTGVVLGTLSAWALLSISRTNFELHACWIMVTCFAAVWLTAHPANPALGFDPSWGYAAQLFTYQQVIIASLVAVQKWHPVEMVLSRLIAQILGISLGVILSWTFFPTIPSTYIKHQCVRCACHLQEHLHLMALRSNRESTPAQDNNAEIHLQRALNALAGARRCITDNDLFVEFKWLNIKPVHLELVSIMERLLHVHKEWTSRIDASQSVGDVQLNRLFEQLRLLVALFARILTNQDLDLAHACYSAIRKEIVLWFSSPEIVIGSKTWDQKYLAQTFAPIELIQLDRLVQLAATLR